MIQQAAFALRCCAAATLSYLLAHALGLSHPVWAAMSALIVSQETLAETRQATIGRLIGTVIGIVVAVLIGTALTRLGAQVAVQMAVAVLLTASVADRHPALRVCMWTCPIVLLTVDPGTPLLTAGLHRGVEVFLGAVIGAALHFASESALSRVAGRR